MSDPAPKATDPMALRHAVAEGLLELIDFAETRYRGLDEAAEMVDAYLDNGLGEAEVLRRLHLLDVGSWLAFAWYVLTGALGAVLVIIGSSPVLSVVGVDLATSPWVTALSLLALRFRAPLPLPLATAETSQS